MTNKPIMRAMIDLGLNSMASIAKQANVDQGNLSAWFTQDRYLSEEAITRVMKVLGIENDELSTEKVYVWRTTRNFEQLQSLLDNLFRNPRLMPLTKQRLKRYELSDLFEKPMMIVVDDDGHKAFVMLKTSAMKETFAYSKKLPWFSPSYLTNTAWLKPIQDESGYPFPEPIQLPVNTLNAWKKGDISLVNFNELIGLNDKVSWQQLIERSTEMMLEAQDIWPWLETIRNARGLTSKELSIKLNGFKK